MNIETILKENKIQIVKCSNTNKIGILPELKELNWTIYDIAVSYDNTVDLIEYVFDLEQVAELLEERNLI